MSRLHENQNGRLRPDFTRMQMVDTGPDYARNVNEY